MTDDEIRAALIAALGEKGWYTTPGSISTVIASDLLPTVRRLLDDARREGQLQSIIPTVQSIPEWKEQAKYSIYDTRLRPDT